jgi:hypothetical protein
MVVSLLLAALLLPADQAQMLHHAQQEMVSAVLFGIEARPIGDPTTVTWLNRKPSPAAGNGETLNGTGLAVSAMEAWKICVRTATGRWRGLAEPPVIVEGAFGSCASAEVAYMAALLNIRADGRVVFPLSLAEAKVSHFKETWRPRLIAQVLEQKSAKRR